MHRPRMALRRSSARKHSRPIACGIMNNVNSGQVNTSYGDERKIRDTRSIETLHCIRLGGARVTESLDPVSRLHGHQIRLEEHV